MRQDEKIILFYLPVVTPWWFENIIVHLIRSTAQNHEVHVLVPPLWHNTGIGAQHVAIITELAHVRWHILDGPDHPQLRTNGSDQDDLLALVDDIAPDITLCRSADITTPQRFPGIVRYIMEGAAPPFHTENRWIMLSPTLFDHGLIPDLSSEQTVILDHFAQSLWAQMMAKTALPNRTEFLARNELTDDKIIIGLSLEYENAENFFGQHHRYSTNAEMILELSSMVNDNVILAITNHPLNDLHSDNSAVDAIVSGQASKIKMLKPGPIAGHSTLALSKYCDGMIVGNSKSWSASAAFATPMMRLSDFATGTWVHAYNKIPQFFSDIGHCSSKHADPALARRWFAFHLLNNVFNPCDPSLSGEDIIGRVINPTDPKRWDPAMARYNHFSMEHAA
ncbi:MAG: hypothetical protein ABJO01_12520 [Parasphingorhabdus sp.]|uniref:hypothetical protein n=1 Tax=Parasphingorhabdus sp. TaxID=2709688 RepID=UPI0032978748